MNARVQPSDVLTGRRLPFECIALVLQGGGALGAYQAGAYAALAEADIHPDWVAGISIGAINAAIIAGNAPDQRVAKLRAFWEGITANPLPDWAIASDALLPKGHLARSLVSQLSAISAAHRRSQVLRPPPASPWLSPAGTLEATSFYYDTKLLRTTLERLVDFDRINAGETRFSVGAVNIRTGNFVYFDNTTHLIRPEHVMASGALPPGFPPVEIDGEFYWDGGLISNTPLQWVVESSPRQDTLAFQVDVWSAHGEVPRNLAEVATRQKDISTRAARAPTPTSSSAYSACARRWKPPSKLPPDLHEGQEAKLLSREADKKVYTLVHLIYRARAHEKHSKDYEFSRLTMQEHWRDGYHDAVRTLRHPEALSARPRSTASRPSISRRKGAGDRFPSHHAKEKQGRETHCAVAPIRCR